MVQNKNLTNVLCLPDTFYQAIANDKYSKEGADYSITELVNPPQITILKQRHKNEIVEDISDKIWSLFGKSIHSILQAGDDAAALQEERLHVDIEGKDVSGQIDMFIEGGKLSDFKVTSVWTYIYKSRMKEWTEQVNGYAYLLRNAGFEVKELEIIALYKDWHPADAERINGYPDGELVKIPVELWGMLKQAAFFRDRVALMEINKGVPDDQLTWCTPDEMWESPTKYAVVKVGGKRAVRVFDSLKEAEEMVINGEDKKLFLEKRPGTRARCEGKTIKGRTIVYCPVRDFCHQYRQYKLQNTQEEVQE